VLVKPLTDLTVREITAPTEKDFFLDAGFGLPVIEDDAFVEFIACPNGSLSGVPLFGDAVFIWE
jgi:hypothetical protein